MKHIILTRFSLFHGVKWPDNSPMWSAMDICTADLKDTDKKMAAYLNYLYSEDRLAYKWKALKNLTIPWTRRAMDKVQNAEWWIYVSPSDIMPSHVLDKLQDLTWFDPRIKIVEIDIQSQNLGVAIKRKIKQDVPEGERYCTLRLDDDDAFHGNLMTDIEVVAEAHDHPFVYCSQWGAKCRIDDDGVLEIGDLWQHWSQHAIGLAAVDENIFSLGNHGNIAKNYPDLHIIHDQVRKVGFLLNCEEKFTASRRVF